MKKYFSRKFRVPASIERVGRFHQDANSLRVLSPPPIIVQFHQVEPLAEGSISDFTLWLGPIPIHWIAIHSEVDPLKGFIDTQLSGPFTFWKHQHRYYPVKTLDEQNIQPHQTEILDEIEAIPGKGFWNGFISRFLILGLPIMFAFRAWQTRKILTRQAAVESET